MKFKPNLIMICQETITEFTESQSIYCQWYYTAMNHTGTLSFKRA